MRGEGVVDDTNVWVSSGNQGCGDCGVGFKRGDGVVVTLETVGVEAVVGSDIDGVTFARANLGEVEGFPFVVSGPLQHSG